MVNNNFKPGFLKNKPSFFHLTRICLALLMVVFCGSIVTNCNKSDNAGENKNRIVLTENAHVKTQWQDVFTDDTVLDFSFVDPNEELITIGIVMITTNKEYIILDGKAKKIIHFDKDRKFVRYISKPGEAPGEYLLPRCMALDDQDNLFLFDLSKRRISKFSAPDYSYKSEIVFNASIQNFFIDNNGDYIGYQISDPDVLIKVDSRGKIVKKAFVPERFNFRAFSSRFQMGRVVKIPGDRFLFTYPEEYNIYIANNLLKIEQTLVPGESSRFFPGKVTFPTSLSPYEYSPEHAKWWGSAIRPANVLYIGNGMIVYQLTEFEKLSQKFYFNIHDIDGKTYAIGLVLPFEGIIRYAQDGYIYAVENSKFDDKGNIDPVKLHRFKLNISRE